MKTFKYLFLIILAFGMSISCSDDEDDDKVNPLVGEWFASEEFDGIVTSWDLTFKENLTGTIVYVETEDGEIYTESENFTWTTEGGILTMIAGGVTDALPYSISGNKLTLDFGMEGLSNLVFTRK